MQADHAPAARKITFTLFAAQGLGSAGFIAAATVASLVGAELSGVPSWAGVPSAVYLLGSALAAFFWGLLMEAAGRRVGLVAGLLVGVLGAGVASLAVTLASFPVLLLGLVLMGAAHAAVQLGRFAAAEVHPPAARGRAIANVVLGGTVGAVVGPLLVGPMGGLALGRGLPELAGPYLASLLAFMVAAAVIALFLRPEPMKLARELSARYPDTIRSGPSRTLGQILRDPAVVVAMVSMVFGQAVMVMLMVITALHMSHHHHPLTSISMVISSHTFGMYAFSVLSGRLSDRWGRTQVIVAGAATLAVSAFMATLSPQVFPLAVALFLLGLGWNFCFVGGSSLLSDRLSTTERARTQGFNDLLIGLASALASLSSGVIFAGLGYNVMGLAGAVLSLLPLGFGLWWLAQIRRQALSSLPSD